LFKAKKSETAEAAEVKDKGRKPEVEDKGRKHKGGKRVVRLFGLAILAAGAALAFSKGLREKALDKLFGAEEQFDYTPPANPPQSEDADDTKAAE